MRFPIFFLFSQSLRGAFLYVFFIIGLGLSPAPSLANICKADLFLVPKPKAKEALIIGGGAFGLSFAQTLSGNFQKISVFVRNPKRAYSIRRGESPSLPGVELSSNIRPVLSLKPFLERPLDIMLLALPQSELPGFLNKNFLILSDLIKNNKNLPVLSLSKGFYFDGVKILFIEDLLLKSWPHLKKSNIYLISGPSFAGEMAQGKKTALNLAGKKVDKLEKVKGMISTESLKLRLSQDMKGVAFSGAVKNIMAIAGGFLKGLRVNSNFRAALLTEGTKELSEIGLSLGADPATFLDLAYLGDVLLSLEEGSRNFQMGLALGRGESLNDYYQKSGRSTLEGVSTLRSLNFYLEGKYGFPFIKALHRILYEGKSPELLFSVIEDGESFGGLRKRPPLFSGKKGSPPEELDGSPPHLFLWNTSEKF